MRAPTRSGPSLSPIKRRGKSDRDRVLTLEHASPLATEWDTYRREGGRLLAEGLEGKFVLIKGEEVISLYDTWDAARDDGLKRYLEQPFLVHQVRTWEPLLRMRGYCLPWRT